MKTVFATLFAAALTLAFAAPASSEPCAKKNTTAATEKTQDSKGV